MGTSKPWVLKDYKDIVAKYKSSWTNQKTPELEIPRDHGRIDTVWAEHIVNIITDIDDLSNTNQPISEELNDLYALLCDFQDNPNIIPILNKIK